MRKLKINTIKLNIIKVALALICISCTPTGILGPKLNNEILKNKDFDPLKGKSGNRTVTRTQKHTQYREKTVSVTRRI
ncbi:complement regulator-acquiring protein [Borreliella lusitaniae]|uniref:Complement regulator-acquiring protein n=1 Tax=Borreliella lusitaniae TaxID=100177 RepID=A0ABZ0CPU8_9SPIR|nr:complement regulator-acquiring protein [Borreliella lusitaniae]WKC84952.1 complement regulator-acquiring protein [Borreliella lusitaniae]WNY69177.1 complement regulator-acquiring protein [Borreliella lusitaniae]